MTHQSLHVPEWLTVGECARRLSVHHSNVSRYLDKHAAAVPSEKRGRERVVDWRLLERHWRENYTRGLMSGEASGLRAPPPQSQPSDAGETDIAAASDEGGEGRATPGAAPLPATPTPSAPAPSADPMNDPARQLKAVQLRKGELGLARELGQVVDRIEAEAAFVEACARLKDAGKAAVGDTTDQLLAALHLPAESQAVIRAKLMDMLRTMLERSVSAFAELDAQAGEGTGGTKPEVLARIRRMAELGHADLAALWPAGQVARAEDMADEEAAA